MAIYMKPPVKDYVKQYGLVLNSEIIADTILELHRYADNMGIESKCFHTEPYPHYRLIGHDIVNRVSKTQARVAALVRYSIQSMLLNIRCDAAEKILLDKHDNKIQLPILLHVFGKKLDPEFMMYVMEMPSLRFFHPIKDFSLKYDMTTIHLGVIFDILTRITQIFKSKDLSELYQPYDTPEIWQEYSVAPSQPFPCVRMKISDVIMVDYHSNLEIT